MKAIGNAPKRVLLTSAVLAQSPHIIHRLEQFLSNWQHVKTAVTGNDLRDKGLPPGPHYAIILQSLRDAWLDEHIQTPSEENALLEKLIAKTEANPHQ